MYRSRFVVPVLLALVALFVAGDLMAQSTPRAPRTSTSILGGSSASRRPTSSTFGAELPPIEKAVDPELYLLGPNDQLVVTIPALEDLSLGGEFPVVVSADYVVGLPRGVTINARGMTLAQFRRAVTSAFERRGGALDVSSVVLMRPRSIYVTVRGDVLNPGRFILTAADRVSTAIDMASEIPAGTPEEDLQKILREQGDDKFEQTGSRKQTLLSRDRMPKRNVSVRHNDGTSTRVDLARYAAFGRDNDNPTLREGDEVMVASPDYSGATLTVAGDVNTPMAIEYERGDNALMLVRLSAGLQPKADAKNAYIARRSETGQTRIPIDLGDTAALATMLLEPGDQLIVPRLEARPEARTGFVTVEGAVGQPSTYPIINGETKLSEVIQLAGGFAPDASINGSYIVRESDPADLEMRAQIKERLATISTSSLTLEDTTRYKFDQMVQRDRVSADFVGLFSRGDGTKDISLRTGDRIVVPENPRSVYVSGRVIHPGAVDFHAGSDVNYYIGRAGGLSSSADASRTQVIKYGTGLPLDVQDTPIEPGDEIYVVGERDLPARTPLEVAATALAVLASLGSITFVTLQIIDLLSK
jgi:protein involved in polysaccharide export with SLBB domain